MAKRVPAYKHFLNEHQFTPESVKTSDDIEKIPLMDKQNYLRKYPMDQLCWDGELSPMMISSSSGSSGKISFWPRSLDIEVETSIIFENFLKHIYKIHTKRTLLINGLAMGVYVGGSFTLTACTRIAQKGYPLSIVTPGINKSDFLQCLKELPPLFDQVIICGYPPFIKDIVDECKSQGIELPPQKLKLSLAAEPFSENFRKYLHEQLEIPAQKYYTGSTNLFGTADAAVAGHETPFTTLVRTVFTENHEHCEKAFSSTYVPSLNITYPFFKFMEVVGDELVLTSWNNGIPLCRYNLHDRAKLFTLDELLSHMNERGYTQEKIKSIIGEEYLIPFPYVAVYGKTDNTVSLYGLLIYAETIKRALEGTPFEDKLTGKFTMQTKLNDKQDQYLEIHLELHQNEHSNQAMEQSLGAAIVKGLLLENAEFRTLYNTQPERCQPQINFHPYGHPDYFPVGIKHRWTRPTKQ